MNVQGDEVENIRDNPKSWVAWKNEAEQLQVQLAGCLTATEGRGQQCFAGDYGWSPAYQAVIELRKLYDNAAQQSARRTGLAVPVNVVIPWSRFLSWLARVFTARH